MENILFMRQQMKQRLTKTARYIHFSFSYALCVASSFMLFSGFENMPVVKTGSFTFFSLPLSTAVVLYHMSAHCVWRWIYLPTCVYCYKWQIFFSLPNCLRKNCVVQLHYSCDCESTKRLIKTNWMPTKCIQTATTNFYQTIRICLIKLKIECNAQYFTAVVTVVTRPLLVAIIKNSVAHQALQIIDDGCFIYFDAIFFSFVSWERVTSIVAPHVLP